MSFQSFIQTIILLVLAALFSSSDRADDSTAPATTQPTPHRLTKAGPFSADGRSGTPGYAGGFSSASGGFGAMALSTGPDGKVNATTITGSPQQPAIITTEPLDAKSQSQLKEDLKIMDKLLRDALLRTAGEGAPRAMGIRLVMLGNVSPMYIEGCGAVFSGVASIPLAAADATHPDEPQPAHNSSAWQQAKQELEGPTIRFSPQFTFENAKFNQEKLDALIDAVAKILPEASNIRGLKPDDSVFVTLSGADDCGAPMRLTFKARKSDIDDASAGKLKPEEFKQHITHRIG